MARNLKQNSEKKNLKQKVRAQKKGMRQMGFGILLGISGTKIKAKGAQKVTEARGKQNGIKF